MVSRTSTLDLSYFMFERRMRDRLAEAHILEDTRQEALEQGLEQGMAQGMAKGITQGMAQGEHSGRLQMLDAFLSEGLLTEAQYQTRRAALTRSE